MAGCVCLLFHSHRVGRCLSYLSRKIMISFYFILPGEKSLVAVIRCICFWASNVFEKYKKIIPNEVIFNIN